VVSSSASQPYQQVVEGFWKLIRQKWPKSRGVTYYLGADPKQNRQIMEEVASRQPDIFFTLGSKASQAIQAMHPQRPVVVTMVLDRGLLAATDQTTGVSLQFPARVHLRLLKRILPEVRHVHVLYDPAENVDMLARLKNEAAAFGVEIRGLAVESVTQLPAALKVVERQAEMLLGLADRTVYSGKTAKAVLLSTFRNRIPFAGLSRSWVKAGALYALERDYRDLGRQCGEMADRILAGTPVADIPPTSPERVRYVVNVRTAQHLRLSLRQAIIDGAAEVFE